MKKQNPVNRQIVPQWILLIVLSTNVQDSFLIYFLIGWRISIKLKNFYRLR